MLIGVDFDHTLVHGDVPIPGAREAMQALRDAGYKILIHSCNRKEWIERVLNNNDIPYDYVYDLGKPNCHVFIDDRAVNFSGDWDRTLADTLELLHSDKTS